MPVLRQAFVCIIKACAAPCAVWPGDAFSITCHIGRSYPESCLWHDKLLPRTPAAGFYGMYTIALLLKAEKMRTNAEYASPAEHR